MADKKDVIDDLLEQKTEEYGQGTANMVSLAKVWTWALRRKGLLLAGQELKADTACLMMTLFKISRELGIHKPDFENYKDAHGYLRLGENYKKSEEGNK